MIILGCDKKKGSKPRNFVWASYDYVMSVNPCGSSLRVFSFSRDTRGAL